ncbi:MAG: TniQ family protein [Acidobacteriia bacterium]|nr:TniQ family protein [Terriglobia bacterium]
MESLTGYASRIADAHAVSVGNLVGRELSVIGSKPFRPFGPFVPRDGTSSHGFRGRARAADGLGETAKRWVGALERATRQTNLRFLTMLPFEGVFSGKGLFRYTRAWCPACYDDWRRTGSILYELLLWTIRLATICPWHGRPLEEVCPHCGGSMKPLGLYARPGYCSKCLEWLGSNGISEVDNRPHPGAQVDTALWYAKAVGELLAVASQLKSPTTVFKANFRACLKVVAEGNTQALAQASKVSRSAVDYLQKDRGFPQLDTILRICHHLDIPLSVFLESDSSDAGARWQRAREVILKGRERPLSWASERARLVLQKAVREQPPPSLSEIAQRLNYKLIERLYQLDRSLSKQIAANYRKSGRSHRWRKRGAPRICERVNIRELLERSLAQEHSVSVHHIAASLGYTNEGYIQRKFPGLCRAIREKCRIQKKARIANMQMALKKALYEDPLPTLHEMAKRLAHSNSGILREYFPTHCDKILARRRLFRRQRIQKLKRAVRSALSESPSPSLACLCKRLGLSRTSLQKMCPHEWTLIRSRYLRTRREASRQRQEEVGKKVRQIVQRLYREGKCPTEPRVIALLPKTIRGAWRTIRAAVKTSREELGPSQ